MSMFYEPLKKGEVRVYVKPVVTCGPGRTKQSFREASDINTIVARYRKTGLIENLSRAQPYYADVSGIGSYHENLLKVQAAQDSFALLPSDVRGRFNNDPGQLLEFLSDESNRDEAISLGILAKPKDWKEFPVVPPAVPEAVVPAVSPKEVLEPVVPPKAS